MAIKKIENKPNRVVKRFRTRQSVQASMGQKDQDVTMVDMVLKKLYNNGDKQSASLTEDILKPNKVKYTESGNDRLWDILLSTGLVNAVVGFGKSGFLTLTNDGYQLMRTFNSYSNFIQQREQQAQANSAVIVPKFILSGDQEVVGNETEKKGQQVDENRKAAAEEKKDAL